MKKKATKEVFEKPQEPVEDVSVLSLLRRRKELLAILAGLEQNGFNDKGAVQVALSVVNRDLASLGWTEG